MKVYISGPMTGLPDFNYPAFDAAVEDLQRMGCVPWSPAEYGRIFHVETFNPRVAFKVFAERICDAEAVYMLRGWESSKGARAEHALALAVGVKIQYQP